MAQQLMAYFGYGSLVNRNTLMRDVVAIVPARLSGWRRHWQARSSGFDVHSGAGSGRTALQNHEIALLSVHRHDESEIEGALVIDYLDNLALLDERERHYSRVLLGATPIIHDAAHLHRLCMAAGRTNGSGIEQVAVLEAISGAFIYVADEPAVEGGETVLLQSYLDAVLAGFRDMHGEGAMERFVNSTTGFDRRLVADRNKPVYPRHVRLPDDVAKNHDVLLQRAGVEGIWRK